MPHVRKPRNRRAPPRSSTTSKPTPPGVASRNPRRSPRQPKAPRATAAGVTSPEEAPGNEHATTPPQEVATDVTVSVRVIDSETVEVTTMRQFKTVLKCPCRDTRCCVKLAVGTYGAKGCGQRECPHCGATPKHKSWTSSADFGKHVRTRKCELTQEVEMSRDPTPKAALGRALAHLIDDEQFIIEEEGQPIRFMCPVPSCNKKVNYSYRYGHCIACFRKSLIRNVADLNNRLPS